MLSYLDYLVFLNAVSCTKNSMHSVESFSACFCEKKVQNNLSILHGL